MKLKITDVMICEWDAETKCIIISAEEGYRIEMKTPPGNGVEFTEHGIRFNRPISEAHASLVTMEEMDGEYSHLIGKWIKRTNAGTLKQSWGRLKDITRNSLHDLNPILTFEDGQMWGKIACDVDNPMDYNPDEKPETEKEILDRTFSHEYRDDDNFSIRHSIVEGTHLVRQVNEKPERKPHQLQEYDAVECTPEERAEIIRIADECGVRVFAPTEPLEGQTSLLFFRGVISGTSIRSICDDAGIKRDWHTVPDFISKIRGEYTAVNVTEHKHESV